MIKRFSRWLYLALWRQEHAQQVHQRDKVLMLIGQMLCERENLATKAARAVMIDEGMTKAERGKDPIWKGAYARKCAKRARVKAIFALLKGTINAPQAPDDVEAWWEEEQARLEGVLLERRAV